MPRFPQRNVRKRDFGEDFLGSPASGDDPLDPVWTPGLPIPRKPLNQQLFPDEDETSQPALTDPLISNAGKPGRKRKKSSVTSIASPAVAKKVTLKENNQLPTIILPLNNTHSSSKVQPVCTPANKWKAEDDYILVTAVLQTNSLMHVHLSTKFSVKFTLREIEDRWYKLLYDSEISEKAQEAMRNLSPNVVAQIETSIPFGPEEESKLALVPSTTVVSATLDHFDEILEEHSTVFHPARTAKSLYKHWTRLKHFGMLTDQKDSNMSKCENLDMLDLHPNGKLDSNDIPNSIQNIDDLLKNDSSVRSVDKNQKQEIAVLESEVSKWHVAVEQVTGISPVDFDAQTLAVLRGRLVRYLMRSKEITVGRATRDCQVDVDLSLEGPAWRVSRKQAIIRLKNGTTSEFYMANQGRKPIYVSGEPVLTGDKKRLLHNAVIEIASLRFVFLINQDLANGGNSSGNPTSSQTNR